MKIIVDVQNSQKLEKLTAEIEKQERAIAKWNSQMKSSTAAGQDILGQRMQTAATKIQAANAAIAEIPATATSAGRGLSQLAYAIDDIQYGFNAIVNNIPQIVMGIGGGAGLAGAIGIAAVAINQIIQHWSEFTALLEVVWTGGSYDQLVTLKERAEAAAEAYKKLKEAKTEWETKGAGIIEKGIANEPSEKVRKQITDALMAGGHVTPEKIWRREGIDPVGEELQSMFRETREGMETKLRSQGLNEEQVKKTIEQEELRRTYAKGATEAARLLGELGAGGEGAKAAREMIKRLIKEAPNNFSDEFKKAFTESDPEAIRKQEHLDAQIKREREAEKRFGGNREEMLATAAGGGFGGLSEAVNKAWEKALEKQRAGEKMLGQGEHAGALIVGGAAGGKAQQAAHTARLQDLEDQRDAIRKAQTAFDNDMWIKQHENRAPQILSGQKSIIDFYQKAAGGDQQKELAKQAHDQRVKTNEKLQAIEDLMKKERRLTVPR